MKLLLKSWVFWAFVVPPLLLAALSVVGHDSSRYGCLCGSRMTESRFFLGVDDYTLTIATSRESPRASLLHADLLDGSHGHTWKCGGRTRFALFGFIACGSMPAAGVAILYENDQNFQAWLRAQVASQAITKDMIRSAVENPAPEEFAFGWTPPP